MLFRSPQRNAIAQPSTGYVLNPSYELPTELPALAQDTGPDINALSAMVQETQNKAAPGAPQQDMQALTKSLLKDRSNYIGANKLPTEDITTAKPSAADNKQRYRTVLPSGDITTAKPSMSAYEAERMPNMQSLTTDKILKPRGIDIPAYTPTSIAPAAITALTQPALDNQQLEIGRAHV